jgi:hypothetical protein
LIGLPSFAASPAEMHHAAHVAGDEDIRLRRPHVFEFERAHRGRDVRKRHRERAAKSAALLAFAELHELHSGNRMQQL